jgi:hypothetical protein
MWLYLIQIIGRLIKAPKKINELRTTNMYESERIKMKQVNHWKKTMTMIKLFAAKVDT